MAIHISSLTPSVIADTTATKVSTLALQGRLSLRARAGLDKLGAALGVTLPQKIGQCARDNGIEVICLGPDEWTLILPVEQIAKAVDALAALAPELPHSVTEITGREVTFVIEGAQAAELMTIGCPRDIATIRPGEARRTLYDGASVVIWCDSETSYRMDVWNSFCPFVAQTLVTGSKELAAANA